MFCLILTLTACGGVADSFDPNSSGEGPPADVPPNPVAKALVQTDLQQLNELSPAGGQNFDRTFPFGYFSKIFGGYTGQDVLHYLSDRIHLFSDRSDLRISPNSFRYTGWITDPINEGGTPSVDFAWGIQSQRVQLGAANFGVQLWLQGLIDGVQFRGSVDGTRFVVDSSRVGIMVIGSGYKEALDQVSLPPAFRQSILVHEARHSDCTGGITQADITLARNAHSSREFEAAFKSRSCGHLHVFCPPGHEYHGLPACDHDPWGAYAIGAIYSKATSSTLSGVDREIMMINTADSISRLLYDFDAMIAGKFGTPDMSSAGLR